MAQQRRISYGLKALAFLLVLAISASCAAAARILDDDQPLPAPLPEPPVGTTPDELPAATATAVQPPVAAPTTTTAVATNGEPDHHSLTFFMHDILGGTHASARVVTGIVASSDMNGALPFAKPNGGVFPISGGVPLPNGVINNNNVPFLTGLGARTAPSMINNNGNGNNIVNGNSLPFVTAGQLPAGSTLQQLLFGTVTVIDDELTEGHELGSGVVGRAQGFYVASSEDGTSQTMAFTAILENGHEEDTISFFGVHRRVSDESQVAIIGGTGKYADAQGYATVKTVHQEDQHTTDGLDTVLEITVYLS
ncbi:dirigent protein 9-like [Aristolochia californica]|uniref:dirigent protein 9-like n=1 Tax=Aristolochia californica TaxID=171875 RepID=UPI0035DEDF33